MLAPAGRDAAVLSDLFWVMLTGAVVLWLLMNGLMLYVTRINPEKMSRRRAEVLILGGGVIFPAVTLAALLVFSLSEMPQQRAIGEGLIVKVTGEKWWWRVEYWPDPDGSPIVSANEIRLPTGQRSEIELGANEVIHSFWIPVLGGKTDMIPGRKTRMSLEPTEVGNFRGQCTEFCGLSHALMAFGVVVESPEDFKAWLEREATDAVAPTDAQSRRGKEIFDGSGCGACHAVRGTDATGKVGPDLTHLGSRTTLAAGTLPMTVSALEDWLRDPERLKPGAKMPAYDHLSPADLTSLAVYLRGLE